MKSYSRTIGLKLKIENFIYLLHVLKVFLVPLGEVFSLNSQRILESDPVLRSETFIIMSALAGLAEPLSIVCVSLPSGLAGPH